MRPVTRRERRAERQRRYAVAKEIRLAAGLEHQVSGKGGETRAIDYEAPRPGWLRPLDYRVSGETGALVVHTHSLSWHRPKSSNITAPPPGREWDGSSRVRKVGKLEGKMAQPVNRRQRTKQLGEKATLETTE